MVKVTNYFEYDLDDCIQCRPVLEKIFKTDSVKKMLTNALPPICGIDLLKIHDMIIQTLKYNNLMEKPISLKRVKHPFLLLTNQLRFNVSDPI